MHAVRFGKYTNVRIKEREVKIHVNGVLANFHMQLGSQGQAYFMEPVDATLATPSKISK